ncbi:MAG: hypothetical protein ACE1ZF_05565, partial [Gemmatimonadales bacterium]
MIKTITVAALAIVGSGLGLSGLVNDAQFDETIPASREGIVTVRVTDGAVSIEGWDRDEVRVTVSGVNRDAIDLRSSHNHIVIRLQPDQGNLDDLQLTITVPKGSSIDVETDGAQVDVDGVEGVVRLATPPLSLAPIVCTQELFGRPLLTVVSVDSTTPLTYIE